MALQTSLSRVSIGQVIAQKHELIQVHSDTPLSDCLKKLNENHILAVPVFNSEQGKYIGILDMFDIMRFTALGFFEDRMYNDKLFEEFSFAEETAEDLIDKSAHSQKVFMLSWKESLLDAMTLMNGHKLPRILVRFPTKIYDKEEKMSGYTLRNLSQVDIVKYLFENLPQLFDVKISQLKELYGQPLEHTTSICVHQPALEGFLKMFDNEITSVAVIEDTNSKIVANLSASDLRGLTVDRLKLVKLPVLEFLKQTQGDRKEGVITCTLEETVKEAMRKITQFEVHQVWIADESGKPIGVITLSNIIELFFSLSG